MFNFEAYRIICTATGDLRSVTPSQVTVLVNEETFQNIRGTSSPNVRISYQLFGLEPQVVRPGGAQSVTAHRQDDGEIMYEIFYSA